MVRCSLAALAIACCPLAATAAVHHKRSARAHRVDTLVAHPATLDAMINRHAAMHGVPESLVHRVVIRESRYNPILRNHSFYGLMQISYATARGMGYKGTPAGLLDPEVNLTYAVPYLANAYKLSGGDQSRAVALYAGGYYWVAKRKKMLGEMRTASSPPLKPQPAAALAFAPAEPSAPPNPISQLFHALAAGSGQAPAAPDAINAAAAPSPEQAKAQP